jgi:hypothetical protein
MVAPEIKPKPLEINGRGDSLRWQLDTLYLLKLSLTSATSGGRSVGIVRLRTKTTEFVSSSFTLRFETVRSYQMLQNFCRTSLPYTPENNFGCRHHSANLEFDMD